MRQIVVAPKKYTNKKNDIHACPVEVLPKTCFIDIRKHDNTIETIELPTKKVTQQGCITSHKSTGVTFPRIMRTLNELGIDYKSVVYDHTRNGFEII